MSFWSFLPGPSSWTAQSLACAAGLLVVSSAGYYTYRRLRRRSDLHLPAADPQPAQGPVVVLEELEVVQVTETNSQLLHTDLEPQSSAVVLFSQLSGTRDLPSVRRNFRFLSSDFFSSQFESVEVRRSFVSLVRGPESQLWWLSTKTILGWNQHGVVNYTRHEDAFTGIQRCSSGSVSELVSCHHTEIIIHVPYEDCVQTLHRVSRSNLLVDVDDKVYTSHQDEDRSFYTPHAGADVQSEDEESDDDLSPEEQEVPFMSWHLRDSGVTDVLQKLPAVREAFSRMLASIDTQTFLYAAGKKMLMCLPVRNKQDVAGVQVAYVTLMLFLTEPSNQESIRTELLKAKVNYFNFLDIFFELIVFRCFQNELYPKATEGGFLELLFLLFGECHVGSWEPDTEQLFLMLLDQLKMLLKELFFQPLELYSEPAALTSTVLRLVMQRVKMMLEAVERV